MRRLVLVGVMALCPSVLFAQTSSLSGRASVVDGDTLRIADAPIRLVGIDAPEAAQRCSQAGQAIPCGALASEALRDLIRAGSGVTCILEGRDKYDRLLGRCSVAGVELNREMVRSGWAVAYWSQDYRPEEAEAKTARRGLWGTVFQQPSAYRREKKQ